MPCYLQLLKAKIHGARVTEARLDYDGSLTLDAAIMEAAGLIAGEKVLVANLTSGSRFETYLIEGRRGSSEVCVNGAAAHLARPGDTLIIMAFKFVPEDEASIHRPVLVYLDRKNRIVRLKKELPQEKEILNLD